MTSVKPRWLIAVATMLMALMSGGTQPAATADDKPIPKDTCILELNLPEGATVTVDGRDYGTKGRFTRPGLRPQRSFLSEIEVRFPDGTTVQRNVYIQPGHRMRLALQNPSSPRPELVLQSGHAGYAPETVICSEISADNKYILTGSKDSTAVLWDSETGQRLRTYSGHALASWAAPLCVMIA